MKISSAHPQAGDDDSNPQQGTASHQKLRVPVQSPASANEKSQFKIPPTKRDSRKLFVGGLPPEVTNDEFKEFFEQFGYLLDSVVMIDRETKCSRGFGFVTFDDPSIANDIIEKNMKPDSRSKLRIRGKWCEVKASEPKERNRQQSFSYCNNGRSSTGSSNASQQYSLDNVTTSQHPERTEGLNEDVPYDHYYDGSYYSPHQQMPYMYPASAYMPGYAPSFAPPPQTQMGHYPFVYPYHDPSYENCPVPVGSVHPVPAFYNNLQNMVHELPPPTHMLDNENYHQPNTGKVDPRPLVQE